MSRPDVEQTTGKPTKLESWTEGVGTVAYYQYDRGYVSKVEREGTRLWWFLPLLVLEVWTGGTMALGMVCNDECQIGRLEALFDAESRLVAVAELPAEPFGWCWSDDGERFGCADIQENRRPPTLNPGLLLAGRILLQPVSRHASLALRWRQRLGQGADLGDLGWLCQAADGNNPEAQLLVGLTHQIVKKTPGSARYWYTRASRGGSADGEDLLKSLPSFPDENQQRKRNSALADYDSEAERCRWELER